MLHVFPFEQHKLRWRNAIFLLSPFKVIFFQSNLCQGLFPYTRDNKWNNMLEVERKKKWSEVNQNWTQKKKSEKLKLREMRKSEVKCKKKKKKEKEKEKVKVKWIQKWWKSKPLLSIPLWAKNLNLHYKPSKNHLWSIEVVHVNYVRLDPFWVRRQPCEVQPHHIMSIVQLTHWEFE